MSEIHNFYTVNLRQVRELFPSSDIVSVGDDFCVIDAKYDKNLDFVRSPCRFDGYLTFFCISGRLKLSVDLQEFDLEENSLIVLIPGNIIYVEDVDKNSIDSMRFIVMAMSSEYISTLKIDINKLFSIGISLFRNPSIVLNEDEKQVAERCLELLDTIMHSGLLYKRESVSLLLSSVMYLAGGAMERRIALEGPFLEGRHTGRGVETAVKYIKLVAENHARERSVKYYAEKMSLTPKYLARVVKESSVRTASDWIEFYVMLEAKNLLCHTNLSVKQIAAELNFSDSPSFCKFFKSHGGETPLSYRNGRR